MNNIGVNLTLTKLHIELICSLEPSYWKLGVWKHKFSNGTKELFIYIGPIHLFVNTQYGK